MAALQGQRLQRPIVDLGDEDPLYTRNISNGPPDRRRVSLRWFAASVLTGVFSLLLVGGALQAAIGLDEYTVVRPALAHGMAFGDSEVAEKGDRFHPVPETKITRDVIKISTVTREQDRNIVRVRPFAHVRATLASPIAPEVAARVPPYQAADVFMASSGGGAADTATTAEPSADATDTDTAADGGGDGVDTTADAANPSDAAADVDGGDQPAMDASASDSIYGAEVDGEVEIKTVDFPMQGAAYDESAALELAEIETRVRESAPFLAEGAVEVASLPYVDPARFDMASADSGTLNALAVASAPENVSQLAKTDELDDYGIEDKVLRVTEGASLRKMLMDEGADPDSAASIQSALVANFSFDFRAGQKVRVGLAPDPDTGSIRPVRVSLYEANDRHIATVALSDNGLYVAAQEPVSDGVLTVAEQEQPDQAGSLPTLHDGLWGTSLTLGMTPDVIKNLVHIFSYDVDYQTRLSASDSIEVIYSTDNSSADSTGSSSPEPSEILYAAMSVGDVTHRFYRFRDSTDGSVDFYDEAGKSAQKFLVRKPVASGRFSSGFGMRRHPILHRYRMHTGIDWAAPSGTRIMAAGDGVVEKIGTRAGYGRSITVKHLHGYETTYNHMSGYAKSLKAGDKVRQGQLIGFIGSSGLSTGPHLHFEVLVNGRFVDPLKIRVPRGRELLGAELVAFEQERQRIDDLLSRDESPVASAN